MGDFHVKVGRGKTEIIVGNFVLGEERERGLTSSLLPGKRISHNKHILRSTPTKTTYADFTRRQQHQSETK